MKTILHAGALCLAILVASCGGSDNPALAETVKLKVNQARTADAGLLTMTMTKFVDSRCPRNVVCVTAGSATIDVTLSEPGRAPAAVQLTIGTTAQAATAAYGAYRLEFIDLDPYPQGPVLTITDSEATLVVRK